MVDELVNQDPKESLKGIPCGKQWLLFTIRKRSEKIQRLSPVEYSRKLLKSRPEAFYAYAADVWGDSRDEAILFNARGLCIYANARPAAIPTLYNETLYPGM
ncbi:MAG: hypothetical protein ISR77_22425 [Pirellulaceae bacterium]|nr:hypothetical protein [Pirellulaceae bacterium]